MGRLTDFLFGLRGDPRLLKVPPYLSALCIVIGVCYLLLLPLNGYSRGTYISENALLPGQVHTYFAGSEQNVFRAYRNELDTVSSSGHHEVAEKLKNVLVSTGLKTATQKYAYYSGGGNISGENVYSVLHAPRGDGTEAIVLVTPWRRANGELNLHGVAMSLTLARYFKRWSLWSKDIIFLFTSDGTVGSQAWVDAYHDTHPPEVESLTLKSGALQGALVVEHPQNHRFSSLHVSYDGLNGQLPNLDLINTAIHVATAQMGIPTSLQHMHEHDDGYRDRLSTLIRGMGNQALGLSSGPHSAFMPYHVDAITLTTIGDGWQDEMAFGRAVEGVFRSLNNLLEHLHQSFFFYLLMQTNRFVSIGSYLPSAMIIAASYTIMAIALWVQSGRSPSETMVPEKLDGHVSQAEVSEKQQALPDAPLGSVKAVEEGMARPLLTVFAAHAAGAIPLYLLNQSPTQSLPYILHCITVASVAATIAAAKLIPTNFTPFTTQEYTLTKCFSLLLLGLFLSTLATINFSLSTIIGLTCTPLAFAYYRSKSTFLNTLLVPILLIFSPMTMVYGVAFILHLVGGAEWAGVSLPTSEGVSGGFMTALSMVLEKSAFAWNVWGVWGIGIVLWGIWWPAWIISLFLVTSR